ncbi:MAG: NADH-quinone oxidoreductase subunit G [Planctomycetota bacterium]
MQEIEVSEPVKLTINGRETEVPKGTNLIEAARSVKTKIPHFCYHRDLSVAGNCRMCMVEVEGMRGLPIACNTIATEGMVVDTESEPVQEARAAIMEFLLINHPIDCPVCDQAGECKLQVYYMEHDRRDSVVAVEDKVKKGKAIEVGPRVMLDQERCVACSRCVRFCDEVTGTGELRLMNRGDHTTIDTFPDKKLDNNYSVNTADICPVGALTSRDFRFQARSWYLEKDNSICPGCSTGCNTVLDHYKQTTLEDYNGVAYRLKPRRNYEVNSAWMCDFGRTEYSQINDDRLTQPVASNIEIGWDGALGHIRNGVGPLVERNENLVAGVASFDCTNEEIWLFKRLMKDVFGTDEIAVIANRDNGFSDDFLIAADKHPNRAGAMAIDKAACSVDLASYLSGKMAVITLNADVLAAWRDDGAKNAFNVVKHKICLAPNETLTSVASSVVLPTTSYAEKQGTWTNKNGRVQMITSILRKNFVVRSEIQLMHDIAATMGSEWDLMSAAEIFADLANSVTAFGGLDYRKVGKKGTSLGAAQTAPA